MQLIDIKDYSIQLNMIKFITFIFIKVEYEQQYAIVMKVFSLLPTWD